MNPADQNAVDLARDLGRIEGKLDIMIDNHATRLNAHSKDIKSLKHWRTTIVAVLSTIVTGLGISLK